MTMIKTTNKTNVNNVNEAHPTSGKCLAFGRRRSKASQVVIPRKPCPRKKDFLKIGTWNVRSMLKSGKLANVIKEMNRLN